MEKPAPHPDQDKTPETSEFADFVEAKLDEFRKREGWGDNTESPTEKAMNVTKQVLEELAGEGAIFPTLMPYYEGILAVWRSDLWQVEIEIDDAGEITVDATDEAGLPYLEGVLDRDKQEKLKQLLVDMTRHVNDVNPEWRKIFTEPSPQRATPLKW